MLPPPPRLWMATLALTLVLVEIPGVLQKCIFDEVQTRTRVVRAAPMQPGDPSVITTQTGQGGNSQDRRTTLQSGKPRKRLVETPASAQPIRIHGWQTQESSNLLQPESEKLQAAVQEAFSVVSSLLSGGARTHKHSLQHARLTINDEVLTVNRASGPLLLSRDINKYCKFLWRDSSTANYNRYRYFECNTFN